MQEFEAIVIGTGFAGAVTACRLVQAGQKICVLERGRRYAKGDFPTFPSPVSVESAESQDESAGFTPSPDFSRWFWNIGDGHGLWEVRDLNGVVSGQAAGYGGGSLIYASVHLRAPGEVFEQKNQETKKHLWPDAYRRGSDKLDPYFDRAAYMLNVKPVHPKLNLAKTAQMQRAANTLGARYQEANKEANQDLEYNYQFQHFSPPLAINDYVIPEMRVTDPTADDRGVPNDWGREQKPCDLRGFCWMGCNRQAKNTLDLNYLAIVEDARDTASQQEPQPPLADIRTLAEVTTIRRDESDGSYEVTYSDHLENQKPVTVRAQYVFLCAGTINTTELLLRNRKKEKPEHQKKKKGKGGNLVIKGKLGDRYFPNGDSLAAIYDCDQPQNHHIGPTITSSLLFDNGEDWFLVQDGGFPSNLEPLFGLFRSPLWTRRNRYLEDDPASAEDKPSAAWVDHHRSLKKNRPNAQVELPFGSVAEALRKLPGDSTTLIPEQIRKALGDDREEILDLIGNLSEERVTKLFDELATLMDSRIDNLVDSLPASAREEFEDVAQFGVSRGMLRLVTQLVWGSESEMARYVAEQLAKDLPNDRSSLIKSMMAIARWALDYRASNDRMALLLTMGKDKHPGELYLEQHPLRADMHRSSLRARLPGPLIDSSRVTQERGLRDIASIAWKGELRTNPVWTFMRRRFTVHGQGGCAMGDQADAVTRASGEVRGCGGLYVMDAAAFPGSVGVNPSATIAAVAEYKIESFIRKHINESWQADPDEKVEQWLSRQPYGDGKTHADLLDPIPAGPTISKKKAPLSKSIGLSFKEKMEGFHDSKSKKQGGASTIWQMSDKDLVEGGFIDDVDREEFTRKFLDAEHDGLKKSSGIVANLTVNIEDLMRFLECYSEVNGEYGNRESDTYDFPALVSASQIPIEGNLEIDDFPRAETTQFKVKHGSYLWLFPNATSGTKTSQSFMKYRLRFDAQTSEGLDEFELNGIKILVDKPGFDVWQDTATLFFEVIRRRDGKKRFSGVLRLHAEELLVGQLQSFKATGTSDPARQSWALAAFAKFFTSQLARIYVPELSRVQQVLKNIVTRTHG